jgi:spore coat polysaccharide biosynthesis protein SpsF
MNLAILQARSNSTRLPRKIFLDLLGKPMILRQYDRIRLCKKIDKIVIATSDNNQDLDLVKLCKENQIDFFCGSLDDVLKRFYDCSLKYKPKNIIRLTGDCPLCDPDLIDKVINYHIINKFDYTCNTLEPFYPDGLDVEILNFNSLKISYDNSKLLSQREHVTQYILNNQNKFKIGFFYEGIKNDNLRLTVDNYEDYELIKIIYEKLYFINPNFLLNDIIQLLEEFPELIKINEKFLRNEGLKKSLDNDKII